VGRFAYLAEREGGRTLSVRQFCLEQNWTAAGWPCSAKRGRVRLMTGRTIPADFTSSPSAKLPGRFAYLAERGGGRTQGLLGTSCASPFRPSAVPMFDYGYCLGRRQFCLEQNWTAAGWPEQSPQIPRRHTAQKSCGSCAFVAPSINGRWIQQSGRHSTRERRHFPVLTRSRVTFDTGNGYR